MNPRINNIIVIAPNWIGDAVMATPVISYLREFFPKAHIAVSGPHHITELFRKNPHIDVISSFSRGGLSGIWKTAMHVRADNYDLAILLPNSFRSALITKLAGIPYRCGYATDGRGFLLNMPISLTPEIRESHQTEYYINIVKTLFLQGQLTYSSESVIPAEAGIQNSVIGPDSHLRGNDGQFENIGSIPILYLSREEIDQARAALMAHQISSDDLIIGINAGAAYGSSKRWHPERYGQAARTLIHRYNAKIILFGSEGERDITDEISRSSGGLLLNMAGRTSIRQLMALISCCKLFITNDSGPMHIAAALSVPVAAIFGSTDPMKSAPVGTAHIVIQKSVSCSPCFLRKCPTDLRCMDLVSVEDVLDAAGSILK